VSPIRYPCEAGRAGEAGAGSSGTAWPRRTRHARERAAGSRRRRPGQASRRRPDRRGAALSPRTWIRYALTAELCAPRTGLDGAGPRSVTGAAGTVLRARRRTAHRQPFVPARPRWSRRAGPEYCCVIGSRPPRGGRTGFRGRYARFVCRGHGRLELYGLTVGRSGTTGRWTRRTSVWR